MPCHLHQWAHVKAYDIAGTDDIAWARTDRPAALPRRRSLPALTMSGLWKALPSSGQRPAQKTQFLEPPITLSRTHTALNPISLHVVLYRLPEAG